MTKAFRGALLTASILGVACIAFVMLFLGTSSKTVLLLTVPTVTALAGFLLVDRLVLRPGPRAAGLAGLWLAVFAVVILLA